MTLPSSKNRSHVLIITGTMGAGNTTLMAEASDVLTERGILTRPSTSMRLDSRCYRLVLLRRTINGRSIACLEPLNM